MEDLTAVDTYLRKGEYPSGIGKGEKANLRRRCRNNFKLEGGVLYYKKALSSLHHGPPPKTKPHSHRPPPGDVPAKPKQKRLSSTESGEPPSKKIKVCNI